MKFKNVPFTLACVFSISSAAQSADVSDATWKVKGKVRLDNIQNATTTKDGDSDSKTTKSSQFKLARAQVEFIGKKDDAELRIKYYGDKNSLKNALVTKKFSDMLSVSVGLLDARDFAWEWDYSTTEQYLFARVGSYGIDNVPGGEIKTSFEGNTLYFQVLQGATYYPTGDKLLKINGGSSGGLTSSFQYRGDFMDHMIQPIFTYAMVRMASSKFTVTDAGTTTAYNYGNGFQTHMGLGVKIQAAGSTTDLEYDLVKIAAQKDVEASKEGNVSSLVFQTRLPAMMKVTPYLKYVADSDKKGAASDVGDITRSAYGVGAEYGMSHKIRVHGILIADSKSTKKANLTDKKVDATTINLGITSWM